MPPHAHPLCRRTTRRFRGFVGPWPSGGGWRPPGPSTQAAASCARRGWAGGRRVRSRPVEAERRSRRCRRDTRSRGHDVSHTHRPNSHHCPGAHEPPARTCHRLLCSHRHRTLFLRRSARSRRRTDPRRTSRPRRTDRSCTYLRTRRLRRRPCPRSSARKKRTFRRRTPPRTRTSGTARRSRRGRTSYPHTRARRADRRPRCTPLRRGTRRNRQSTRQTRRLCPNRSACTSRRIRRRTTRQGAGEAAVPQCAGSEDSSTHGPLQQLPLAHGGVHGSVDRPPSTAPCGAPTSWMRRCHRILPTRRNRRCRWRCRPSSCRPAMRSGTRRALQSGKSGAIDRTCAAAQRTEGWKRTCEYVLPFAEGLSGMSPQVHAGRAIFSAIDHRSVCRELRKSEPRSAGLPGPQSRDHGQRSTSSPNTRPLAPCTTSKRENARSQTRRTNGSVRAHRPDSESAPIPRSTPTPTG